MVDNIREYYHGVIFRNTHRLADMGHHISQLQRSNQRWTRAMSGEQDFSIDK